MADVTVQATASFESPDIARTKLVPPRLRSETIDRPRLVARRLDSPARLGFITGPAGSGKSTLLAQCHAVEAMPAWLSLGPADNDPGVMWTSIIETIRTVIADFGDAYRTRLGAASPAAIDDIVVSICNELADRDDPVHLFVDDLHVVQNVVCRQSLHHFVSSIPDGVRVTVASRSSDPVPLARLRAAGDLVEIDAADLALSSGAARQLLTTFGVQLDQEHLDLLVARTEGWPAGLHLAGLAVGDSSDPNEFVDGFRGTEHDIAAYLLSEVLDAVSDHEREFLIETALLHRLSGDLCNAVTGRSGGAQTLERLEHASAFVIALDRQNTWYRYHHLFRELLSAELHRIRPDRIDGLHRRAFEWLRDDGQVAAAIPHGLAAGEPVAAADLLCRHWFTMMSTGRNETARRLIARFPDDFVTDHQPLAIAAGSIRVMTGDQAGAMRWLDAAKRATFEGPRPDGMASTASSIALLRGSIAPHGVEMALRDGRTALELEPPDSPWRGLAHLIVGRALVMRGDADGARDHLVDVTRHGAGNAQAYATAELSLLHLRHGEPERAMTDAETSRRLLSESGATDVFMAAIAEAAVALAAIELGDVRTARIALRAARRPMEVVGQAMALDSTHSRLLLAAAALALDEADLARRYLRDAQSVIDSIDDVGEMRDRHAELMALLGDGNATPDAHGDVDFTARELQVLSMLPSPLTLREIGDELFLSANTVKTHVRNVYRKLNASSREEAVLVAADLGLIPDEVASRA